MADQKQDSNSGGTRTSDSKERILQAAIKEFAQNGLAGARVDQIAAEAGVNKAMIYYHYSSKQNLYREAVKATLADKMPSLRRRLMEEGDLEAALKYTLDFHADIFYGHGELAQLFLRELANPESPMVDSIAGIMKDSGLPFEFTRHLSEGARRGAYRAVDVRQTMISFISMSIGFFLMSQLFDKVWQFTKEPAFIEERKAAIIDLFLNGVKPR